MNRVIRYGDNIFQSHRIILFYISNRWGLTSICHEAYDDGHNDNYFFTERSNKSKPSKDMTTFIETLNL